MPRQMKLWEMLSVFRDQNTVLEKVLRNPKWQAEFWQKYQEFGKLTERQDRQILDALVPVELSREVAAQCPEMKFHFNPEKGTLHKFVRKTDSGDEHIVMTALEVHDQFGGSIIEEVLEKGSANVEEWQ
jgi:hypothetical protein